MKHTASWDPTVIFFSSSFAFSSYSFGRSISRLWTNNLALYLIYPHILFKIGIFSVDNK